MTTERHIIIAFLYHRSGKTVLTESELYLSLSMDLGWMTTGDAQAFVHEAIKDNLLIPTDNGLSPAFDVTTIIIPSGFTPKKKLAKPASMPRSLLDQIVAQISHEVDLPQTAIAAEVAMLADEKSVIPEVAALWVARHHNCDISGFYEAIEATLLDKKK